MGTPAPDVVLRSVTKRFGGVTAVDELDLEVAHGEFLSLLGPSGCGKTMNNEPTARKMDAHLEDAVGKGATIVVGGSRASGRPTDLYYEPTVITEVAVDTLINREETFGPIVPLIRVGSDDEALAVANDSHLGLQAAVYTSNLKRAFKYLDNLQVGNVVVNDSTDYWEAHEPFGGASGTKTGWGRIGAATRCST